MKLTELEAFNQRAREARPWTSPEYSFRPVSPHDPELHRLKSAHPYFGYIEIEVSGIPPFVMLSNNDDVVAQTYFWFGPDSYESLSVRVWRRLAREVELLVDVGAYSGLFTLAAALANPEADLHAFEPDAAAYLRLLNNLSVNRLGQRVVTHRLAAADVADVAELHAFQGELKLTTGSSLVQKSGKKVEQRQTVRTCRLDETIVTGGRRTAVKIDAEEVEDRVLEGLRGITESTPTQLLVEVASVELLERCLDSLPGYTFAVLDDEEHAAMLEDPRLLELRDANARGERAVHRRISPPNVLFRKGSADALAGWLEPLVQEPRQKGA